MPKFRGRDVTQLRELTEQDEEFKEMFDPANPKVVIQDSDGKKVVPKRELTGDGDDASANKRGRTAKE